MPGCPVGGGLRPRAASTRLDWQNGIPLCPDSAWMDTPGTTGIAVAEGNDRDQEFPKRLRSWRHRKRLTQQKLAEALGYDVTYIAKLKGGTRPPSRAFLARWSSCPSRPRRCWHRPRWATSPVHRSPAARHADRPGGRYRRPRDVAPRAGPVRDARRPAGHRRGTAAGDGRGAAARQSLRGRGVVGAVPRRHRPR